MGINGPDADWARMCRHMVPGIGKECWYGPALFWILPVFSLTFGHRLMAFWVTKVAFPCVTELVSYYTFELQCLAIEDVTLLLCCQKFHALILVGNYWVRGLGIFETMQIYSQGYMASSQKLANDLILLTLLWMVWFTCFYLLPKAFLFLVKAITRVYGLQTPAISSLTSHLLSCFWDGHRWGPWLLVILEEFVCKFVTNHFYEFLSLLKTWDYY